MVTLQQFGDSLAGYIGEIKKAQSEATIRYRCLTFLQTSLGITLEPSDELEQRVFHGRTDATLGSLIFEFKRSLKSSLDAAQDQLRTYLTNLHRQNPNATYTGIACDGLRFRVYRKTFAIDDVSKDAAVMEEVGTLDLEATTDSSEAFLWLDSLFAHFRTERAIPTARALVVALGPDSPTFRNTAAELLRLYREVQNVSEVAIRFQEWQYYLSIVYGSTVGNDILFVRHTYLALVARLVARFFLEPTVMLTRGVDLVETINGQFFRAQGIDNFIEDDFFTWILESQATGVPALDLVSKLAASLSTYDFDQTNQDLLKGLYEALVDPDTRHELGDYHTPAWLAEHMLETELQLSQHPDMSVLDPSCGSGTFLFTAIRLLAAARQARRDDALDTLLHLQFQVMGMDAHPVAVLIARTNYLLALGELIKSPHPPVLLPVYLSNALVLPGNTAESEPLGGYKESVHTVETSEPGVQFEIPDSVATNPVMLDWLFARMPNYLDAAKQRLKNQTEEEATQEVLNAFHNYLVAPKPNTPIPEPLSAFAVDIMLKTAQRLVQLYLEGKDHVWLFTLKNIPASIYLSQRKFDLVVGNPPWLPLRYIHNPRYSHQVRSQILDLYRLMDNQDTRLFTQMDLATLFFTRAADLYLKDDGRIAMVLPHAVLTAHQHSKFTSFAFKEGGSQTLKLECVLDLEGVTPLFNMPACVLIARNSEPTVYPVSGTVFTGNVPARNASLTLAEPLLQRTHTTFDLRH